MIDFGHIVIVIKSERFDNAAVKKIAMLAVIGIRRYSLAIEKSALRGTVEHLDRKRIAVEGHAEIRSLFAQGFCPIIVTSLDPVLLDARAESFFDIVVGDVLPVCSDSVFSALFLNELEKFAV